MSFPEQGDGGNSAAGTLVIAVLEILADQRDASDVAAAAMATATASTLAESLAWSDLSAETESIGTYNV